MAEFAIDRFEGDDWVVLENAEALTFRVPRSWIPIAAREGDVLRIEIDGPAGSTSVLRSTIDPGAKAERLRAVQERRDQLARGPKGDLDL